MGVFILNGSEIDLQDLELEWINDPMVFKTRDYDLRKGVYVWFAYVLYDEMTRCPDCGATYTHQHFDVLCAAVFVDGERVEGMSHGGATEIEVNSEGESRFINPYVTGAYALRIKTK